MTGTTLGRTGATLVRTRARNEPGGRRATAALKWLVLALALGFSLLPILYLGTVSLKSPDDILSVRLLPSRLAWSNWTSAFSGAPVFLYLRNSLVVAAGAALLALLIAVPAVYAMVRLGVGERRLMGVIVSAYIAPPVVAIVPLFLLVRTAGLMDSLLGQALIEGLLVTPVAVWLLEGFFRAVPQEVDEAAEVDGAGPIMILVRVLLPLVAPGLVAVAIISFILVYNDFLIPLMLAYGDQTQTLPVGLSLMQGGREVMFGQMAAASLTGMIPVYVLAVFMQRWLIGGLTQGSVK